MTTSHAPQALTYGALEDQLFDLYLPSGAPSGLLLLLIHGGDWQHAADRSYLSGMASALADLGHAVASLEFRRLGGGGGWPTTFTDISTAVATVPPQVAPIAAAAGITLDRTVLVGHSAGGHLALWASAQPLTTKPPLAFTIALGPTADLALAHELGATGGAVEQLLGGTPSAVPEVLAQADPSLLTPRVPVRIVHAETDTIVPSDLARSYAAKVDGDVELTILESDDHFIGTKPGGLGWAELLAALAEARAA